MKTLRLLPILISAFGAACATAQSQAPAAPAMHEHAQDAPAIPDTARYTAADVVFMSRMIGHHSQAIEMSHLAETRASSNSIRTLAARIINAQQDEIATMRNWLRDRGQPVPEVHPTSHGMHDMMPGMLSPEQMAQLEAAQGRDFEALFLTFMIQHHRGAVEMVRELFSHPGGGEEEAVFKFASDVNVDQNTEIARMQRMLADLIFEDGPS